MSTIFRRVARQRVKVTDDGRSRYITKLKATVTQLSNQAASGELRAIRDFLSLLRQLEEPVQVNPAHAEPQEIDRSVMKNILKRLRQSEEPRSADGTNPETINSSKEIDG